MVGVGADVLEDERARRRDDQNLQHEVVQRLKEDLAECLRFNRRAIVVAEEGFSLGEITSLEALIYVHFKLVTDAFEFYTPRETN